jgi:Methionine synthase I (cobalamin-dependent), methyltransferase domain
LRDIAEGYLAAGADIVGTNSFGANRFRLKPHGLEGRADELSEAAARITKTVLDRLREGRPTGASGPWCLGSMGPSGLVWGEASILELSDCFAAQAAALARGGADALCVETAMDAREAAIALSAAKEATGLELVCCYSFMLGESGQIRTIAGQSLAEAVAAALDSGADIVGANCGDGFDEMRSVLAALRGALRELGNSAPIMVSPNAGMPRLSGEVAAYPGTAGDMGLFARDAFASGASIVGGCCGTDAEHVAAIRRAADGARPAIDKQ